jgi:hypothetical protein
MPDLGTAQMTPAGGLCRRVESMKATLTPTCAVLPGMREWCPEVLTMESISGTAQVFEVSPEVMDKDPELGNQIAGTTLYYEGFEIGDDIVGWVGALEVTVTAAGMYVEAIHADPEAAKAAATARASG